MTLTDWLLDAVIVWTIAIVILAAFGIAAAAVEAAVDCIERRKRRRERPVIHLGPDGRVRIIRRSEIDEVAP